MNRLYLSGLLCSFLLVAQFNFGQLPAFGWVESMKVDHLLLASDNYNNIVVAGDYYLHADLGARVHFDSEGYFDIFIQKLDASGIVKWTRRLSSPNYEECRAITTDSQGNIYLAGGFYQVDFDPGPGTHELTSVAGPDVFILKLDPNGDFLWVKSFGGNNFEYGSAIHVADDGSIYTGGYFDSHNADFDPGTGQFIVNRLGTYSDGFLQKCDSNGNFLWVRTVASANFVTPKDIETDPDGNVYWIGRTARDSYFSTGDTLKGSGYSSNDDGFVQKLTPDGESIFTYGISSRRYDNVTSITTDGEGNCYVMGAIADSADLDPGLPALEVDPAKSDAFLQKIDSSGNLVWVRLISCADGDYSGDIALDTAGNICITGYFDSSINLGTDIHPDFFEGKGCYLRKMSPDADVLDSYVVQMNGYYPAVPQIECLKNGEIFLAGNFYGSCDFDNGPEGSFLQSSYNDYFILKLGSVTEHLDWNSSIYDGKNSINLYPNPVGDYFTIEQPSDISLSLQLFSMDGKMLYEAATSEALSSYYVATLSPGEYILKVISSDAVVDGVMSVVGETFIKKIVKL